MLKQIIFSILIILISFSALSEVQHHNFSINICRTLPSGDIQIAGKSETDSQNRLINFSTSSFQEKVIDRYLSLCLTSLSSGAKLRIDYLDCSGTSCTATSNTSLNLYK